MIIYPKDYVAPAEVEISDPTDSRAAEIVTEIKKYVTSPKLYGDVADYIRKKFLLEKIHLNDDKLRELIAQVDQEWKSEKEIS